MLLFMRVGFIWRNPVFLSAICVGHRWRPCVKCGSVGSNTCKMRETVRVISRILHMENIDPLTMNGVLGVKWCNR